MNDTAHAQSRARSTILILEDNLNRLDAMRDAVESLGKHPHVQHWDNAPQMIAEAADFFANACLISLDYDLSASLTTAGQSPGNGMDVVRSLVKRKPFCPVIIHSSLPNQSRRLAEALQWRGWTAKQVPLSKREEIAK